MSEGGVDAVGEGQGEGGEGEVIPKWMASGKKTKPTGRPREEAWEMSDQKRCTTCEETKPCSEFYWQKANGRKKPMSQCKECIKADRKNSLLIRGEEINNNRKKRYEARAPILIERTRQWCKDNPWYKRPYDSRRREAQQTPEFLERKAARVRRKIEKAEKAAAIAVRKKARAEFRASLTPEEHKRLRRIKDQARAKIRRETDPAHKALLLCRNRITCLIRDMRKKGIEVVKLMKTRELIGCTPTELVAHLEAKFTEGMTWANHGLFGWHIDHIKPCDAFPDLNDPAQQKACFHFLNLQPLWWQENQAKKNKYNE